MLGNFNMPCVDHLREGIDYRIVDWNFADQQPAPQISHTPGQPCPEGTKMIWGLCRRVDEKGEAKVGDDTDEERKLKGEAQKAGSDVKSNKAFTSGGKKFGWAIKGGKPVLVEWGSVAGEKKVGPKKPAQAPAAAPSGARQQPSTSSANSRIQGLEKALAKQTTPEGRKAIEDLIREQK